MYVTAMFKINVTVGLKGYSNDVENSWSNASRKRRRTLASGYSICLCAVS